ncbi:MAG: hypothetical protein CMI54_05750 [Parcubacteria group bacterium]|nr:hypothetical protein [Parcubacteria group bacterium]
MSAGKGDKPRPVNRRKYGENFENIFGYKRPWWETKKKGLTNKKNPLSFKDKQKGRKDEYKRN